MSTIKAFIKSHPVLAYYALTFTISWVVVAAVAVATRGRLSRQTLRKGEGGASIGQGGHSKDGRPDLKQMVVGAALDEQGRPVACALLPGNATEVKMFSPAIKAPQSRFEAGSFGVVADRGMISQATIQALEAPGSGIDYILGCRMRRNKEVRDEVMGSDGDLVHQVCLDRQASQDTLVLERKEVRVEDRRYVVCFNPEQAFRAVKSVLETRPIYHKCGDTIRGHVLFSFLALMLMRELLSRLASPSAGPGSSPPTA